MVIALNLQHIHQLIRSAHVPNYNRSYIEHRLLSLTGCTPLINRVRHHLASQCFEIDDLAAISKCQKMLKMKFMHSFFMLDVLY